jgi:D-sedoheptulose 7-phosphate isomerase
MSPIVPSARSHLATLQRTLRDLEGDGPRLDAWGEDLADRLLAGGRLLAVGNGGSAAEAQHLTAELVGRYREERIPLSALALCTDSSALTAIGNDYGIEEVFARQVRAHGRRGDVLVALSTSGASPNVLAAVDAAHETGMTTWALTGPAPNPLAGVCDDAVCIDADTPNVQEGHLVCVHLLCNAIDRRVAARTHGVPSLEVVR